MYNYTIKDYKAVKSTLKTQITVFSQANNKPTRATRATRATEAAWAYYRCGEVVYGCTTPLIHLTTGSGCLLEKFFIFYFGGFLRLHIPFWKIFFKFFFRIFFQIGRLVFRFFIFYFFLAKDGRSEYICSALDWCLLYLISCY